VHQTDASANYRKGNRMKIPDFVTWIIYGLIASAIVGAGWYVHHTIWTSGHEAGKAEIQAAWDKEKHDALLATMKEDAAVAKRQEKGDADLFDVSKKFTQGEVHAKAATDNLRSDIRHGAIRLSIPVNSPNQAKDGEVAAVAGGSRAEERAELVPAVADDIVAIAIEGDAAMRQLNQVIDAYAVAVVTCSGRIEP
jgi:hypothetical protein